MEKYKKNVPKINDAVIVLMLVFFICILVAPNFLSVRSTSSFLEAEYVECIAYALCFWILLFAATPQLWLGIVIASLCTLWWSLEIYLRLAFAQPVTTTAVGMVMDTDGREVSEFLAMYGRSIIAPAALLLLISVALGWCLYQRRLKWTHRSRSWVLLFVPGILSLPMLLYIDSDDSLQASEPFVRRSGSLLARFSSVYPLDLPISIFSIKKDQSIVREIRSNLAEFDFKAKLSNQHPETIVLVIGESSRSDRWQLFGYRRQTTPKLAEINDLTLFPNVVTESTATRYAVPNLISRRPFFGSDGAITNQAEPSILTALKQVGYRTFWLSNQGVGGYYESPISIYASDADEAVYLNPSNYNARGTYDEVILGPFLRKLDTVGRKFIVLHTLGSHFDFSHRYPPAFDVYRPSLTATSEKSEVDESLPIRSSNSYDNTIRYTDSILSQIIELVKKRNDSALVVYISDHGQDLFDAQCGTKGLTRASSQAFVVPAFIWASEKANRQIGVRLDVISRLKGQPKMSNGLPQTLLDLIGVSTPSEERTSSWFENGNQPRRVFASSGWADFDRSTSLNSCEIKP